MKKLRAVRYPFFHVLFFRRWAKPWWTIDLSWWSNLKCLAKEHLVSLSVCVELNNLPSRLLSSTTGLTSGSERTLDPPGLSPAWRMSIPHRSDADRNEPRTEDSWTPPRRTLWLKWPNHRRKTKSLVFSHKNSRYVCYNAVCSQTKSDIMQSDSWSFSSRTFSLKVVCLEFN